MTKRTAPSRRAKTPTATRATRYQPGDTVKVVAPGDQHHGQTGTVEKINEGAVWLRFSPLSLHIFGYQASQLKAVAPGSNQNSTIAPQSETHPQTMRQRQRDGSKSAADALALAARAEAKAAEAEARATAAHARVETIRLKALQEDFPTAKTIEPSPKTGASPRTAQHRNMQKPHNPPEKSGPGVMSIGTRRSPLKSKRTIGFFGLGLLVLVGLGVFVIRATSLTSSEKYYLKVIHNPCGHTEIYDPSIVNYGCPNYFWQGSDREQVKEGHEICSIEASVGPGNGLDAVHRTIGPRHPYYSDTQINTEEIAARQILCK